MIKVAQSETVSLCYGGPRRSTDVQRGTISTSDVKESVRERRKCVATPSRARQTKHRETELMRTRIRCSAFTGNSELYFEVSAPMASVSETGAEIDVWL